MKKRSARLYKKLCKKAAQAIGLNSCSVEDGVWQAWWDCSGADYTESDCEDAWPYLVSCFDSEVNTMIDYDSECGISWKPDRECLKATPKNVLRWAKNKTQFYNF